MEIYCSGITNQHQQIRWKYWEVPSKNISSKNSEIQKKMDITKKRQEYYNFTEIQYGERY